MIVRSLGARACAVTAVLFAVALGVATSAPAAGASVISGTAFEDMNRNGSQDPGEAPLASQQLYLLDAGGQYLGSASSDASGRYEFGGLADGGYRVEFSSPSWWALRDDWVPTTTGSIRPTVSVNLTGSATADFGWRPIIRSTDINAPITAYVGANGLRVNSYTDAVAASEVYDAVMRGTVGAEAEFVTIRFGYSPNSSTVAAWQGSPGSFERYNAVCYDNYISWLVEGDLGVSHEYGHAWSLYYDTIVQQEGTLASYLKARGLEGDARVNTTYAWGAREMIAEDYRQLLGSPSARIGSQMNRDIPPAADVPGLRDFLLNTFTAAPVPPPPPAPAALTIASLAVTPAPVVRSGTVSLSLSAPASLTVAITTSAGDVVRTLLSSAARPSGATNVAWDRKNAKGQRVKAGTYKAVVTAVGASGENATASASFPVA